MHHDNEHRTQNLNPWRNLLLIWTALLALIVHRTTGLGLFVAIVAGFLIAAVLVRCAYFAVHRRQLNEPDR